MSKKKDKSASSPFRAGEEFVRFVLLVGSFVGAVGFAAYASDIFPKTPRVGWIGAGVFLLLAVALAIMTVAELLGGFSNRLWKHWIKEIGLLTSQHDGSVTRSSLNAISANASRLCPFLTFEVPNACEAEIGFVLSGSDSQQRLRHKARYTLQPGKNLISAPEWISLEKMQAGETWMLKVSINDQRMATRKFTARHEPNEQVGIHLDSDGQIDEWLSANISERGQEPLSLNELLQQDPPRS
jgi:hypothetical protein